MRSIGLEMLARGGLFEEYPFCDMFDQLTNRDAALVFYTTRVEEAKKRLVSLRPKSMWTLQMRVPLL